jgi:Amt family ammonium transporter
MKIINKAGIASGCIETAFLRAFPLALLMYVIIRSNIGLRASKQDEQRGLDFTEHYEIACPEFQSDLLHPGKN